MTDTITKHIHIRIGSDGTMLAVTDDDIENGTTLDEIWSPADDTATYYDRRIAVTAKLPDARPEEPAIDAGVTLAPPADDTYGLPLSAAVDG